jgi:hypothetical protein
MDTVNQGAHAYQLAQGQNAQQLSAAAKKKISILDKFLEQFENLAKKGQANDLMVTGDQVSLAQVAVETKNSQLTAQTKMALIMLFLSLNQIMVDIQEEQAARAEERQAEDAALEEKRLIKEDQLKALARAIGSTAFKPGEVKVNIPADIDSINFAELGAAIAAQKERIGADQSVTLNYDASRQAWIAQDNDAPAAEETATAQSQLSVAEQGVKSQLLSRLDTDNDGAISKEEAADQKATVFFDEFNTGTADDVLDEAEINKAVETIVEGMKLGYSLEGYITEQTEFISVTATGVLEHAMSLQVAGTDGLLTAGAPAFAESAAFSWLQAMEPKATDWQEQWSDFIELLDDKSTVSARDLELFILRLYRQALISSGQGDKWQNVNQAEAVDICALVFGIEPAADETAIPAGEGAAEIEGSTT